jgi:hypothetical protein
VPCERGYLGCVSTLDAYLREWRQGPTAYRGAPTGATHDQDPRVGVHAHGPTRSRGSPQLTCALLDDGDDGDYGRLVGPTGACRQGFTGPRRSGSWDCRSVTSFCDLCDVKQFAGACRVRLILRRSFATPRRSSPRSSHCSFACRRRRTVGECKGSTSRRVSPERAWTSRRPS